MECAQPAQQVRAQNKSELESNASFVQLFVVRSGLSTSIVEQAFMNCGIITTAVIPDGVTTIGKDAFRGCKALTSVVIPTSVAIIGNNAFQGCEALILVEIPDSVTTIGESAFEGCQALTCALISDRVSTINRRVFYGCEALTSVVIPDGVTTIGESAFCGCKALTSALFFDGVLTIGAGAFKQCKILTGVVIPDGVTTIGDSAFQGCAALDCIAIPDSVTTIGEDAFSECRALTSIVSSDPNALDRCKGLPASVLCQSVSQLNRKIAALTALKRKREKADKDHNKARAKRSEDAAAYRQLKKKRAAGCSKSEECVKTKAMTNSAVDQIRHFPGFPKVRVWCAATKNSKEGVYDGKVVSGSTLDKVYIKYTGRWTGLGELKSPNDIRPWEENRKPLVEEDHQAGTDEGPFYFSCVCGLEGWNIYDGSEYIQCDRCDAWAHTRCNREVQESEEWVCHNCMRRAAQEKEAATLVGRSVQRTRTTDGHCVRGVISAHSFESGSCVLSVEYEDGVLDTIPRREVLHCLLPEGSIVDTPEQEDVPLSTEEGAVSSDDVFPTELCRALPAVLWPHASWSRNLKSIVDEDDDSDDNDSSGLSPEAMVHQILSLALSLEDTPPHDLLVRVASHCSVVETANLLRCQRLASSSAGARHHPLTHPDAIRYLRTHCAQPACVHILHQLLAVLPPNLPASTTANAMELLSLASELLQTNSCDATSCEVAAELCRLTVQLPWRSANEFYPIMMRLRRNEDVAVRLIESLPSPRLRLLLVHAASACLGGEPTTTTTACVPVTLEGMHVDTVVRQLLRPARDRQVSRKLLWHGTMAVIMAVQDEELTCSEAERQALITAISEADTQHAGLRLLLPSIRNLSVSDRISIHVQQQSFSP